MKKPKMFGLAAVAAMALMAFVASSASATALYNGTTRLGTGSIFDFSIPAGGSTTFVDTSHNTLDTCTTGTIKGTLNSNGPVATGTVTEFTWGSCTFTTKTLVLGKLLFIWIGGTNGTVESDDAIEVTINTVLFGSCIYGVAAGTSLGTLTTVSSATATLDINAVMKRVSGSICPETLKWTGIYTSTQPDNLRVESS